MGMASRIHLIAPAGSCRDFFPQVGVDSASALIALVQEIVGPGYHVTGGESLIEAVEDHEHGGRTDDPARAADITEALADSNVSAIVMLRGGAWFTRILPRIDFSVLDRRATRIAIFGFSELTPLINIVGAHRNGLGLYSMGPVFLGYGLKRYARLRAEAGLYKECTPHEWMLAELPGRFRAFFRSCIALIEGRAEPIMLTTRLVRGRLPDEFEATLVGGNLTVLSTMIGSRFADAIDPAGKWLLLEDYNDKAERFDRYLTHLTLAGYWDRCAGVLLGDFHQDDRDLTAAVLEMLKYHLPRGCPASILTSGEVGHTWPMTPVPLHRPATASRADDGQFVIRWPIAKAE